MAASVATVVCCANMALGTLVCNVEAPRHPSVQMQSEVLELHALRNTCSAKVDGPIIRRGDFVCVWMLLLIHSGMTVFAIKWK